MFRSFRRTIANQNLTRTPAVSRTVVCCRRFFNNESRLHSKESTLLKR